MLCLHCRIFVVCLVEQIASNYVTQTLSGEKFQHVCEQCTLELHQNFKQLHQHVIYPSKFIYIYLLSIIFYPYARGIKQWNLWCYAQEINVWCLVACTSLLALRKVAYSFPRYTFRPSPDRTLEIWCKLSVWWVASQKLLKMPCPDFATFTCFCAGKTI
jgi:hypothetical protein